MFLKQCIALSTLRWFAVNILCYLQFCKAEATCVYSYKMTNGKYFKTKDRTHYTDKPYKIYESSRIATCAMIFTGETEAQSMNVVEKSQMKIECQLFEKNAEQEGKLTFEDNSTYYEKFDNYLKATPEAIEVGAKDDKPGTFIFRLPTGSYKIRLNHLSGGLIDNPSQQMETPFGGVEYENLVPNKILLVKDFNGDVIAEKSSFTEWERDAIQTRFLSTSACFPLNEGMNYSFWYGSDHNNFNEDDNQGKTLFEMFVKLCDHANACT